jgi:hypothetical protein
LLPLLPLLTLWKWLLKKISSSDDAQWTQLITELSQLGSYYDQQIKARETRRKNKDNNSNDEPLIVPQES